MKPVLDTSFLIKLKKNNEKVVKALKKYKKSRRCCCKHTNQVNNSKGKESCQTC